MALPRKLLKGMGLNDEQIDAIIDGHNETVDALKAQIDAYKEENAKIPALQKELDDLKKAGDGGYEQKYNDVKKEFDDYKAEQAAKESKAAKENAYRALLREAGISEKRIGSVLKVSDVDGVELAKDGTIKGADKLAESIKSEWADFIPTTETKGATESKPPANTHGGATTKADILKMRDPIARQKAIGENLSLFGVSDGKE